ncbi:MAG: cytochrome-c oxidase, cbb3-type subunit III [Candidimonas sp.]|nr:MAG: cytochrome-c oxidase, cbb3-type subunit III [Candidimonas sp.]TAM19942.1 MAG: cytochrome-c oxidase, cbb3-type subunit III [Candidimonas sp.]TAM76444.1 MAG: cytochrome-c oxidase, cbb3-type subunit III [Candidimonas sp.]
MSNFWSWWVMVLIVVNLSVSFFLFLWGPRAKIPTLADGTTGHVWANGALREGVHRLPLWWIVISFLMFACAFGYLVLYPGFGNSAGRLGWTSHQELASDTAANDVHLDAAMQRFAQMPIETLAGDHEARVMGKVLFGDNCAACHGSAAHGNPLLGAPNLTDTDWLYGGDGKAILTTILNGRRGVMPAWGPAFGEAGVENLANYVLSLSGAPHDATKAMVGKSLFAACAACHGAEGKGNQILGAPNLTDTIWLYGGNLETVEKTIRDGRNGNMPAWSTRLSENEMRVLAAYVYSFSHGNPPSAR